jgi:hypothetical protein
MRAIASLGRSMLRCSDGGRINHADPHISHGEYLTMALSVLRP